MDNIREAFQKVKQDMDFLYQEINSLKLELNKTTHELFKIHDLLTQFNEKNTLKQQQNTSTHQHQNPTTSTYSSTHNLPLEALKAQNMAISTGNQGVSTDRQTDRQTDTQHQNYLEKPQNNIKTNETPTASIDNAAKILDSLDSIKKEIRLKFKRLTNQELLVFSALYQLDEETGSVDYRTLAQKLNLTESSVRDYVGRLIKKGIPVDKKRVNNKTIALSISENLKKIASLSTILKLREI